MSIVVPSADTVLNYPAPQVVMGGLPASWDGDLIMVDHMAGFVSTYFTTQIISGFELLYFNRHTYIHRQPHEVRLKPDRSYPWEQNTPCDSSKNGFNQTMLTVNTGVLIFGMSSIDCGLTQSV